MSHTFLNSRTARNAADAATANLSASGGLVVLVSAADPLACHLPAAAESAAPGTVTNMPLGIIETAEDVLGGRVTYVSHGVVDGIVGGAGLAAGTRLVSYDANGALIAFATVAGGAGVGNSQWTVGYLVHELGDTAAAAGTKVKVFFHPQLIQCDHV